MRYLTQILCPGSVELEAHFADREYRVKAGMLAATRELPEGIINEWVNCGHHVDSYNYAKGQPSQIDEPGAYLLRSLGEVMFYVPTREGVIGFLIHNDLLGGYGGGLRPSKMTEKNMRKVIRAAQRYGRKNGIRPLGHS